MQAQREMTLEEVLGGMFGNHPRHAAVIEYRQMKDRITALEAEVARLREDAGRLDWMKPGFRYLAGDHVEQVMWPDENGKVRNLASVPKGSGIRAAIDAAMRGDGGEG